jgi:hypothetical protein
VVKLGGTGKFPDGSLGPHDEGELKMAIAVDRHGNIHFNFGKDVSWFALPKGQAIDFAKTILTKAGAKKIEVEF